MHRDKTERLERLVALTHALSDRERMAGAPWTGGGRRRRGDVRQAILRLLAEEPHNGYSLMQTIEHLSGGRWRPSPGSIYPTLAQLEDEGLVRATEQDGGKRYELTDVGREAATQAPGSWSWESEPEDAPDLRSLMKALALAAAQVWKVGDERQRARAGELLERTRRELYRILAGDEDD
jgi:DNA-binding PadR family transcriptional regulator